MKALTSWFSSLSPSDKRALSILAGVSLVMFLVFGSMSVRGMNRSASLRAEQAEKQFKEVLTLAKDFASAKAQKEALSGRIRSSRVQLESDIEAAAGSLGIEIHDMKNQSPVPGKGDELREERLRITIKAITLDRFAELMSKLLDKRSGDLIRVRELSLKTQFDDREKVKATFVMSTWRRNS
ncbi:MAG: type II secretion system protein GspM [Myxococcota bacterium]|jgi:hypothetical protein|nr:type II secretion system protein GspM [Myxococcota bacterium]